MATNKIFLCVFIFSLFVSSTCAVSAMQSKEEVTGKEVKAKRLLEINKRSELIGYVIKNNEIYVGVWIDTDGKRGKDYLYKYEKDKLKDMKFTEAEIDKFMEQKIPKTDNLEGEKLEINSNKYLILRGWSEAINFYNFYISDGKKEKNVTNDIYLACLNENYLYIDKENEKIYFDAWNRTKYSDKATKEEKSGLYVYDINANTFTLFKGYEDGSVGGHPVIISYINPIRVPNTSYLMYIADKEGKNGGESTMTVATEVWIEEIPEWKAELENKNKSK
jgi:hypothetical protein